MKGNGVFMLFSTLLLATVAHGQISPARHMETYLPPRRIMEALGHGEPQYLARPQPIGTLCSNGDNTGLNYHLPCKRNRHERKWAGFRK